MSIPANASLVNGGRIGTASNGLDINRYAGEKYGGTNLFVSYFYNEQNIEIFCYVILS